MITLVSYPDVIFPAYNQAAITLRASNGEQYVEIYIDIDGKTVSRHRREFFSLATPLTDNFLEPITDNSGQMIPIGGEYLATFDVGKIVKNFFSNALIELNAEDNSQIWGCKSFLDRRLCVPFRFQVPYLGGYDFTAANAALSQGVAEGEYTSRAWTFLTELKTFKYYSGYSNNSLLAAMSTYTEGIKVYAVKREGPASPRPYEGQYSGIRFRALGNSFTGGYRATNLYGYAQMLAAHLGVGNNMNLAIPGGQMVDISASAVDADVQVGDVAIILPGFNDCAQFGDSDEAGIKLEAYKRSLMELCANLCVPESDKIRADNVQITYTGDWESESNVGISQRARHSGVAGSTASFSIVGNTLYVSYIQQRDNGNSFEVYIDGSLRKAQNCYGEVSNGGSISTRVYEAALLRVSNLGDGTHAVNIKVVKDDPTYHFWLQWVSGVPTSGAAVYVGNPGTENEIGRLSMVPAGYGHYTWLSNRKFKQVSVDVWAELKKDGNNIAFIDTDRYDSTPGSDMVHSDNIHPNDRGHEVLEGCFMEGIMDSLSGIAREVISDITPAWIGIVSMVVPEFFQDCALEVNSNGGTVDRLELKVECVPHAPFYVRWVNRIGGREHWMFSRRQNFKSEVDNLVTYDPRIETNADLGKNPRQISLTTENTVIVGAQGILNSEFEVLRKIITSPLIEYYDKDTNLWRVITIKTGATTFDTLKPVQDIELEFILPTQALQF